MSAREWIARPSVSHCRCVSPSWSLIIRRFSDLLCPMAVSIARLEERAPQRGHHKGGHGKGRAKSVEATSVRSEQ